MDKKISRLQYVTQDHPEYSHEEQVKLIASSGCDWIQLRMKEVSFELYLATAKNCAAIAHELGAKLIVNDNLEIALQSGADGVHLGLTDLSTKEAREKVDDQFIIGGTANTLEDVKVHYGFADYVGIGPYQFTSTKKKLSPIVGADGFSEIVEELRKKKMNIPLIAIGGIGFIDTAFIAPTGVYGIAVSSGIINASDVPLEIKKINAAIVSGWNL